MALVLAESREENGGTDFTTEGKRGASLKKIARIESREIRARDFLQVLVFGIFLREFIDRDYVSTNVKRGQTRVARIRAHDKLDTWTK